MALSATDDKRATDDQRLAGPLADPLEAWPNSDLLMEGTDRDYFARYEPRFAPIFDWPEHRALFRQFEDAAARARGHSRRAGLIAVGLGFAGLILAALVPLVELWIGGAAAASRVRAVLGGLAAALALASVIIGYAHVLKGTTKVQWITNRYLTERLRQFHFQLIVTHPAEVVGAVGDSGKLKEWLTFRQVKLDQFKHENLRDTAYKLHHLEADVSEEQPWVFDEWAAACAAPDDSPELARLLEIMNRQRFEVQLRYAEKKLTEGWHSPETRMQWVSKLSDVLTAVLLIGTVVAGWGSISVLRDGKNPAFVVVAAFIVAVSTSSIVAMRALKEGLLFSADAERYRWYFAAVSSLRRRFEAAAGSRKLLMLRDLEVLAYQELRRFLVSASHARFIM